LESDAWYKLDMHNFRQLDVWNRALAVTEDVYRVTTRFPKSERYGLVTQMRRSAVSVVSNIAEGSSRTTKPDVRRFLSISRGSASELEAQLIVAERIGLISSDTAFTMIGEVDGVRAMLVGLARNLADSTDS
jgi:four helix bundle protein